MAIITIACCRGPGCGVGVASRQIVRLKNPCSCLPKILHSPGCSHATTHRELAFGHSEIFIDYSLCLSGWNLDTESAPAMPQPPSRGQANLIFDCFYFIVSTGSFSAPMLTPVPLFMSPIPKTALTSHPSSTGVEDSLLAKEYNFVISGKYRENKAGCL